MNDSVENEMNSNYSGVKKLIDNLGMESTDTYISLKIFIITKQITMTRERIYEVRKSIDKQRNSDEIRHLEYDVQEEEEVLNNLLEELKAAYNFYEFYKLQNITKIIRRFGL